MWVLASPLQIALVAPFSGPYRNYGNFLLAGSQLAIASLNDAGGIQGQPLEMVPIDDRCDPTLAREQAQKIIKQPYVAIIGHACSAAMLPTLEIYAQSDKVIITPTATNPKITQHGLLNVFRLTDDDEAQTRVAAEFLVKHLNSQRIAVLHDQSNYGRDLADLLSTNLIHSHCNPLLYLGLPSQPTALSNLMQQLKILKIDAIYFAGFYREASKLAKILQSHQLQIPLITPDAVVVPEFVSESGGLKAINNVITTFGQPYNHPALWGHSLTAYMAVEVIASALRENQDTRGAILANWLHQNTVSTSFGTIAWDTNGNLLAPTFQPFIWKTPTQLAVAFPAPLN